MIVHLHNYDTATTQMFHVDDAVIQKFVQSVVAENPFNASFAALDEERLRKFRRALLESKRLVTDVADAPVADPAQAAAEARAEMVQAIASQERRRKMRSE